MSEPEVPVHGFPLVLHPIINPGGLWGLYGILGVEPGLAVIKASALSTVYCSRPIIIIF